MAEEKMCDDCGDERAEFRMTIADQEGNVIDWTNVCFGCLAEASRTMVESAKRERKKNIKEVTDHEEQVEILEDLASSYRGELRRAYSGRCMYGKTCFGVVVAPNQVDAVFFKAQQQGLGSGKLDDMGMNTIVYFPHVTGEAQENPEEE